MKENQNWKIRIALTIDRGGNMVDVVNFIAVEVVDDGRKFAYMQQCRAADVRAWDAETIEDFEGYMFARLAAVVDSTTPPPALGYPENEGTVPSCPPRP